MPTSPRSWSDKSIRNSARKAGLLIALLLASAVSSAKSEPQPVEHYSQRELLKNWALSLCLAVVWDKKSPQASEDANISASGYFEFSNASDRAFDQVRKLTMKYAKLEYGGSIPGEFNIMKCIDLYHSKALNQIVNKYVKEGGGK